MSITGTIQLSCNLRQTPADCHDSGPVAFLGPSLHTVVISQLTQTYLPKVTQSIFCFTVVAHCWKEYIQIIRLFFLWFNPS